MGKTIGRRMVDIGQKARGRLALRYELEVIPYLCGDIPDGVTHCSFAWERGTKLFVTEAEAVNANTHAVFWKQYLRQSATMYKDGTELLPKVYAFKVQSVKAGSKPGEEKRKTVGKVHVNLAQFCSEALDAQPQEMLLHLKPVGKLKVSIKATWLRNATVDADSMTEVTAPSLFADSHYNEEDEDWDGEAAQYEEQDLSGFDPETGQPLSGRQHRHTAGASTSGAREEYDEEGNPIRRKSKKHRRRRMQTYEEEGNPEDAESGYGGGGDEGEEGTEARDYGDPGGGSSQGDPERHRGGRGGGGGGGGEEGGGTSGRRGKAGSRASKGEGRPRLQVYGARQSGNGTAEEAHGTASGAGGVQIEAGRQVHRTSWRDYLCCCLPRQGPAEDPLEGDSLLTKGKLAVGGGNPGGGRNR